MVILFGKNRKEAEIYAVRVKIVIILLGESREVAERDMREAYKVLIMFLGLGTVYIVFSL